MAKAVTKTEAGFYGRTAVPAHGHITQTFEQHDRITPSASAIPAEAYVQWSDGEETWERLSDIRIAR